MKHVVVNLLLFGVLSTTLYSQSIIPIDFKTSKVYWKSSMLFSFGGHEGTVDFSNGNLISQNGKIMGGYFTIDMNTLVNTDGGYSRDLVRHLKNEDFFNVKKYPTSSIVFTKVNEENERLRILADLTIKGITKPIAFDAIINDDETLFTAHFKIDRTDWNINYGSKGQLQVKDYAISDAIEFNVELHLNSIDYNPFSK